MKPEEQPPIVIAHGQANAEWVSDGEPSLTRNHEAPIVAFSSKDSGLDAAEDLSPTLRSMNNKDSNMNGGGQVAIAFKPSHYTRDKDGAPSELAPPLSADADKGDQDTLILQNEVAPTLDDRAGRSGANNFHTSGGLAIAFTERGRADGQNLESQEDVAYAVTNPGQGGRTNNRSIATPTCVRRLTPTECLRLQGLPDDWLSGFEFSDTVKYRQIGNSVAVPVFEWVAKRIAAALKK